MRTIFPRFLPQGVLLNAVSGCTLLRKFGGRYPLCIALVAVVSLAMVSPASAQGDWVGKTIIVKKRDIKIGMTDKFGKQVYLGTLQGLSYKVLGDMDGWIKVDDRRGNVGWFDKADAVLLDDAPAYFTGRIRKNPNDVAAFNSRAWAWSLLGKLDIALIDYGEVIRLDPEAYAFSNRASVWVRKKNYAKALADFNEAIRIDPNYEYAYTGLGLVYEARGEYAQALDAFRNVIRLNPKGPDGYNSAAWVLATAPDENVRNGKKAVEYAQRALDLAKTDGGIMDTLAAAHAETGNFDEAVRWQEKAMQDHRYKNDNEFINRLAQYRMKQPHRIAHSAVNALQNELPRIATVPAETPEIILPEALKRP